MKTERDYLMRQIHQVARDLGGLLTKDSLKEFINYDLDKQNHLTDKEIDILLLISTLKDTIDDYQISEEQIIYDLGISLEQIDQYYYLDKEVPDQLINKIKSYVSFDD